MSGPTHELEFVDLAYAIEQAREPREDTDGYLVGWTGRSSDAATWTAPQEDD